MALKSTVHRAQLQVSDMDRHYYAEHQLTVAQHPSETDQRVMLRLLAFALFAHERLQFGRGLSSDDEPDLWRHELDGSIALWVEMGQVDESRLRRACGRARRVVLIGYGGNAFLQYWTKQRAALARLDRLAVVEVAADTAAELGGLLGRSMDLQCLIDDGEVQFAVGDTRLELPLTWHQGSLAECR